MLFRVLSFDGPDAYAQAGGIASGISELTASLASRRPRLAELLIPALRRRRPQGHGAARARPHGLLGR